MTTAAEVSAAEVRAARPRTVGHRLGVLRHASGDVLDDPAARLESPSALHAGDGTGDRR